MSIPASVTEIGSWAFHCCNISELSHPCLTIHDGFVIKDGTLLYCASQAANMTIPEGVTKIGNFAFADCTSLASVVIPEGVTEIDILAFSDCTSLAEIRYGGTKAQWDAVEKGEDWNKGVPATEVLVNNQ